MSENTSESGSGSERALTAEATGEENAYLLTCEVTVTWFDENSNGTLHPCGQPAVNGFLCAEHSRRAREVGAEEALVAAYGCAPCAKVIVRAWGEDGKEYRMLHFDADAEQQGQEMFAQLGRFTERAKKEKIVVARGPFVLWQSAFEVDLNDVDLTV